MIDRSHVPTPLHSLMPLLYEWAVTDNLDRSRRVEDATIEQLQDLVIRVDAADQACTKSAGAALLDWLWLGFFTWLLSLQCWPSPELLMSS